MKNVVKKIDVDEFFKDYYLGGGGPSFDERVKAIAELGFPPSLEVLGTIVENEGELREVLEACYKR